MILAAIAVLLALVVFFTSIQTFYLEGMRLRTRDLPSLQYFKSDIEPRLKLRSEDGTLTFSLWKHTCLLLFGILVPAQVIDGGGFTLPALLQSIAGAWLLMMLCAYLIPQLLVRRTSAHWIVPLLPLYSAAALVIRPLILGLRFLHSLLDIATDEAQPDEPATPAENIETLITAGAEEGLIEARS
jgi:hypothetical protein